MARLRRRRVSPGPGEKGYDPLAIRKALHPGAKFSPTITGPDFTHRSTGVIKGNQVVTKNVSKELKNPYHGTKKRTLKDDAYLDMISKQPSYKGMSGKKLAEAGKIDERFIDAYNKKIGWKDEVTTGTPDQTIEISQKFSPDSETADKNDGGSAITTDVPNDDTTKPGGKKGGMPEILAAATGTGGNTKINRSNPVDGTPVSDGSSADPTFKAGLNLNNQAVNKA